MFSADANTFAPAFDNTTRCSSDSPSVAIDRDCRDLRDRRGPFEAGFNAGSPQILQLVRCDENLMVPGTFDDGTMLDRYYVKRNLRGSADLLISSRRVYLSGVDETHQDRTGSRRWVSPTLPGSVVKINGRAT
jgi:hypothetical protein